MKVKDFIKIWPVTKDISLHDFLLKNENQTVVAHAFFSGVIEEDGSSYNSWLKTHTKNPSYPMHTYLSSGSSGISNIRSAFPKQTGTSIMRAMFPKQQKQYSSGFVPGFVNPGTSAGILGSSPISSELPRGHWFVYIFKAKNEKKFYAIMNNKLIEVSEAMSLINGAVLDKHIRMSPALKTQIFMEDV